MNIARTFSGAALLFLTACTGTEAPPAGMLATDMRLMPADRLSDGDHLILTIPPGDRSAMMAASRRIEERYGVDTVAEWPLESIGAHCLVLGVPPGTSADTVATRMSDDAAIRTAQKVQGFRTLADSDYPDDHFKLQHGLKEIRAPEAHQTATGKEIRIAVIDTGVDFSHPDLNSRKAASVDFVGPTPGIAAPPETHGTAVAGVIAADAENGRGIVGVAPDAKIMGLRACWQERSQGRCNSFSLARALNVAINKNADVINMSLGGTYDPLIAELIERALNRGILVVAAKEAAGDAYFPASMPGVVAVRNSSSAIEANLTAPGTDIISTAPADGYDFFSGASVSAAHASGVAALMLERNPKLQPDELGHAFASVRADKALDACSAVSAASGERQAICE